MGKRMGLKAKADLPGTFSLPASMAALDLFLGIHKSKSQGKTHRPLFLIYASHDLPQLLPLGGMDRWSRLDSCLHKNSVFLKRLLELAL